MTNEEKLEAYNGINLALASASAYLDARHKVLEEEFGTMITKASELREIVDEAREGIVNLIVDLMEEVVLRHDQ